VTVAVVQILSARLALEMLRVEVLASDLQVLSEDWLLATSAHVRSGLNPALTLLIATGAIGLIFPFLEALA